VADYSDRIGLVVVGWWPVGLVAGLGRQPVGAGLDGQWLGQFAVRWAATNILLCFWFMDVFGLGQFLNFFLFGSGFLSFLVWSFLEFVWVWVSFEKFLVCVSF